MDIAHLITYFEGDTTSFDSAVNKTEGGFDRVVSGANKTSAAVSSSTQSIGNSFNTLSSQINSFGSGLQSLGTYLTGVISAPIAALGALGIRFNETKEQSLIAFRVLLKDGEAAKKLFGELQKFAETTPFEQGEVVNSAKMLKAYGYEVKELMPLLTDAGNLASGMGAKFEDVARVFGRLKSGDFGEAFERLRDFGISRKQLEGEGLKFDKSGQYQGSVEQATNAVRNIIQKNFGGMMKEQSATFGGLVSTLWDTINVSLGKALEPAFNQIVKLLPDIISGVSKVSDAFQSLSPTVKTIITVIGGLAVIIPPILVVAGGIVTAIASVVGAIGALVGSASIIGIVAAAIIGLGINFAPLIAMAGALFLAWKSNFGNIQGLVSSIADGVLTVWVDLVHYFTAGEGSLIVPFIISSWNDLKAFLTPVVQSVSQAVSDAFGATVKWVRDNYPLIKDTVITVIDAIKNVVGTALAVINSFWDAHGTEIKRIVGAAWDFIKTFIGGAMDAIGDIIKLVMQVITGDWEGSWTTIKDLVRNGADTVVSLFLQLQNNSIRIVEYIGQTITNLVRDHWQDVVIFIADAVSKIGETILKIPLYVVMAIPAMLKAGFDLAKAFYEGAKKAFTEQKGLTFDLGQMTGKTGTGNYSPVSAGIMLKTPSAVSTLGVDAEKASNAIGSIGDSAEKSGDSLKKLRKEASETWTASSLAAFVQNLGYTPGSGFTKKGHNTNSKHYRNRALDIPIDPNDTDRAVKLITEAIKAGIRVRDERVRPPGQKAWTGSHIHLEEGDDQASFFQPGRLGYGNSFELLKALDLKRVANGGKDIASALESSSKGADVYNNKLENLTSSFQNLTATTQLAKLNIELLGNDFKNLTPVQIENLRSIAKQIDAHNELNTSLQTVKETVESLTKSTDKKSFMQDLTDKLADPKLIEAFKQKADEAKMTFDDYVKYLKASAFGKDAMELVKGAPKLNMSGAGVQLEGKIPTPEIGIIVKPKKEISEEWKAFAEDVSSIFGNAFDNLREGGFKAMLRGMLLDFTNMINQMAIKWATSEIFKAMTGEYPGGESQNKSGGWLSKLLGIGISAVGAAFGGKAAGVSGGATGSVGIAAGRASGGPVTAGVPYIVGEYEPELFVPRTNGTIYNQKQLAEMRGGESVTIINNNHAHFHANERTGAFSKASAEQTFNSVSQNQRHSAKKSNRG